MRSMLLLVAVPALALALFAGPAAGGDETPFRIAYIDPLAGGALCVADITTEARGCLLADTDDADLMELAWSPDGTMIAVHRALYTDGVNDGEDLVVVAADGGDELPNGQPSPLVLSDDVPVVGVPQWSSDSTRIAMLAADGSRSIAITRLSDGSQEIIEVEGVSQFIGADIMAWSPDNAEFAIGVYRSDYIPAIMLVDAESGASSTLMEFDPGVAGGRFEGVSWSPDGEKILFTRIPSPPSLPWTGANSEHWIINRDGSGALKLYDSPSETGPSMEARFSSPAGATIAFDGLAEGVPNIFLIDSDGSNMRQLTSSPTGASRPRWWPSGDTHILHFDSATNTMNITASGSLGEIGGTRPMFYGERFEWAPAWGTLPPNLVLPTPTAEPMPPSPPVAQDTPISPPVAATTASPPPGTGIIGPDTGSGPPSSGDGFDLALLAAALLLAIAGGGLLLRTRR